MKATAAEKAFRKLLKKKHIDLASTTPRDGLDLMIAFYCDERVKGVDLEADGDMLLCEWGSRSWNSGDYSVDFCRQVIQPGKEDDDAIWQLRVVYRFAGEASLKGVDDGRVDWLGRPADAEAWRNRVVEAEGFASVAERTPSEVQVSWEPAG
jgi:hypothetical protein